MNNSLIIPEIELHKNFIDITFSINDCIIAALEEHKEWDISEGYLPPTSFDNQQKLTIGTIDWVEETNSIIRGMNIVILDLCALQEKPYLFGLISKCSLADRAYLLFREFFDEYYRLRERFFDLLSFLVKFEVLTKVDSRQLRKAFNDNYAQMIYVRNINVHRTARFKGEQHHMLWVADNMEKEGIVLQRIDSGETETVDSILNDILKDWIDLFSTEGKRLVRMLDRFTTQISIGIYEY